MKSPDDPVCLCFHVTRRKILNFLKVEKPLRPSQLSQCGSAGTGCGWCVPYLERLFQQHQKRLDAQTPENVKLDNSDQSPDLVDCPVDDADWSADDYAQKRAEYLKNKKK